MIRPNTLILAILCCFFNCSCQKKAGILYEKYILPDSLVDIFNNHNDGFELVEFITNAQSTTIPYKPDEFETTFIVKVFFCGDSVMLMKYLSEYNKHSIIKVSSSNNNYFIIASERELCNKFDTVLLRKRFLNFKNENLLISFHQLFSDKTKFLCSKTICGLPEDYQIIVLKSANTYVLPLEYKYEWEILPNEIKHGYRVGIAYSKLKKYIIQWIVAW